MSNTTTNPLSTIIDANAKIAMPEILDVFLTKYENDLYERKDDIHDKLAVVRQEMETHNTATLAKIDFKEFDNLSLAKLKIKTQLSLQPKINWTDEIYTQEVSIMDLENPDMIARISSKTVTKPILKTDLKKHDELKQTEANLLLDLDAVVSNIANMSRKERQVKARISEMRLQEQGLDELLQDPQLQKLISLK